MGTRERTERKVTYPEWVSNCIGGTDERILYGQKDIRKGAFGRKKEGKETCLLSKALGNLAE